MPDKNFLKSLLEDMTLRGEDYRDFISSALHILVGNNEILIAKKKRLMGQWSVEVVATVSPANGEWLTGPPQLTVFQGSFPCAKVDMVGYSNLASDVWVGYANGLYPEPQFIRVEGHFMNEQYNPTTLPKTRTLERVDDSKGVAKTDAAANTFACDACRTGSTVTVKAYDIVGTLKPPLTAWMYYSPEEEDYDEKELVQDGEIYTADFDESDEKTYGFGRVTAEFCSGSPLTVEQVISNIGDCE
jgi:hypothetical protein